MDQPANYHHSFHHFAPEHDPPLFGVDDTKVFELVDTSLPIFGDQDYFTELEFQDLDPIDEYLSFWELWDDGLPLLSYNNDQSVECYGKSGEGTGCATVHDGGSNGGGRRVRMLALEEIRKHFEMPMAMAAKELRVGLTVLKKRCRELNIKRWPHRKLKSLKSLIQNVKEMGLTVEIEMLEEQKRMIEKVPEVEFTKRTKKLRQACFKASYKKRKLNSHHLLPLNYIYSRATSSFL